MRRTIILLFTLGLALCGIWAVSVSFARPVGLGVRGGTPTPSPTVSVVTDTPTAEVPTETQTPPDASATDVTETATSTSVASETSTPTTSATETPAITGTIPTATCVPSAGAWSAGPDLPTALTRGAGVYFPADGNFYIMGGRSADTAGSNQLNPLEFDTTTGVWSTKSAVYDDNQVNNQACAVLTQAGTPYIFCVGGSAAASSLSTSEIRRYDPITDTLIGFEATDAWPGNIAGSTLPGGYAVANNKLYIIGGYTINVGDTNEIWEYDPNAVPNSRWTQEVDAPGPLMYAATATIGDIIYIGGASSYDGSTVIDTNLSFSFNPVSDTIGTIANIPRATGETRAVVVNNRMWVLGGGRDAPNPSNEVDIYDPATDTWSLGPSFATPRRNTAAGIDPSTNRIWIAGGYNSTNVELTASLEIFTPDSGCQPQPTFTSLPTETPGGPTRTPRNSATSIVTPTGTPTECSIMFEDVPLGATYYAYIRCLACKGIINGYSCGIVPSEPCNAENDPYFRPNTNISRGQFAKLASNAAGFNDHAGAQQFVDVPPDSTFYPYIWRIVIRGIAGGYPCGGPGEPCIPYNAIYFRPGANITRGQLAKIDSNIVAYNEEPTSQQYEDVLPRATFFAFIWRLTEHGIINGYPCGGTGEPCGPNFLPYFRPAANATRGQASKFIANTVFPECPVLRK